MARPPRKSSKMGRPKKEINWEILDSVVGLNASLDYACERQLIHEGTYVCRKSIIAMRKRLERAIRARFECTFVEYRHQKGEPTRLTIFQQQVRLAKEGNATLLIWLGKVLLGQREEQLAVTINNNPTTAQTDAAIEEIRTLLKAKACSSTPTPPLSLVPSQGLLARS